MLLRYVVSNFRSIGHPLEFSMFPPEACTDTRLTKTIKTRAGDWKVLRRGGVFGPNASGKSSLIQSVAFAKDYLLGGQKSGVGTGIPQFRGDFEDLEGASGFQFLFYLDGDVYEYGFTLDRHRVREEWLNVLTDTDMAELFRRTTDEDGRTSIVIADAFAAPDSTERNLAELLKNSIKESQQNQLFLYKLFDNGIKKAEHIIDWFRNIVVVFPTTTVQALPWRMKENESMRLYISEMLKRMDTGVEGVSVESGELDFRDFVQKQHVPQHVIDAIEANRNGIVTLGGKSFIFFEDKKNRTMMLQLMFNHRLNSHTAQFNIDEESDGTQRLVDLLPMLFSVGQTSLVYFIDEIDRSLHTKLTQFMLDEFTRASGDGSPQIVFTAHDVNLINLEHFLQEEIWFVEKNTLGESIIRPLSDFQIKAGQDPIRSYLNGRFGAIPVIRGMRHEIL